MFKLKNPIIAVGVMACLAWTYNHYSIKANEIKIEQLEKRIEFGAVK